MKKLNIAVLVMVGLLVAVPVFAADCYRRRESVAKMAV